MVKKEQIDYQNINLKLIQNIYCFEDILEKKLGVKLNYNELIVGVSNLLGEKSDYINITIAIKHIKYRFTNQTYKLDIRLIKEYFIDNDFDLDIITVIDNENSDKYYNGKVYLDDEEKTSKQYVERNEANIGVLLDAIEIQNKLIKNKLLLDDYENFTKRLEYRKGATGEYIVKVFIDSILKDHPEIKASLMSNESDGPHYYDFLLVVNGVEYQIEIKTKPHRNMFYLDQGFNESNLKEYLEIDQNRGNFIIIFVDENGGINYDLTKDGKFDKDHILTPEDFTYKQGSIYGASLKKLMLPISVKYSTLRKTSSKGFSIEKYPFKGYYKGRSIRFFSMLSMSPFTKILEEIFELENLDRYLNQIPPDLRVLLKGYSTKKD